MIQKIRSRSFWALVLVILALLVVGSGTVARADAPQPYTYALVQCSGLSVAELQVAEQKFDTWYGWQKQLTTPAQWLGSYEARVNEFASTLGCPKVLDNGALTFNAKIYLPWYRFYLSDYPTPY